MLKNRTIEPIGSTQFESLIRNSEGFIQLFEHMCQDLYPSYSTNEIIEKYRTLLDPESEEREERSATIGCLMENGGYQGILINHYYAWEAIAPQLCYKVETISANEQTIQILPFGWLVPSPGLKINQVAEIATLWVQPSSRQQGLGTALFNYALRDIDIRLNENDYYFLAAISRLNKSDSERVFNYITENGKKIRASVDNELDTVQREVSFNQLIEDLHLNEVDFSIHVNAKPVEHLASVSGMAFVGYFRTFSKIFGAFKG